MPGLQAIALRVSRHRRIAAFLAVGLFVGLALLEVWPQWHVHHLRKRGGLWQDAPSFLIGDCSYYRATTISILDDFDLDIGNNFHPKQYQASHFVALGARGEWYPKHPILMPLAALPFYAIARDVGLITFNLAQLTALLMFMWWGARRYTTTPLATGIALWYGFGTMMRATAYNFAPDIFSSLLVTGGLVLLLYGRVTWSGVLLGFACWAKWTNAIFVPLPVMYLGLRSYGFRNVLRYGIAAGLPIAALLALNWHMFGSPFLTPYDRVLIKEGSKMVLEPSHRTFFNLPFWGGIWDQLTDKDLGLLIACPPVLLAPIGAWLLARRVPAEVALIVSACLAQIATFAKYEQWRESSYGPRFLMTVVTLSALLVAPVLQRVFMGHSAGRYTR